MNADNTPDINLYDYTGPEEDWQDVDDSNVVMGRMTPNPDWNDTLKYTSRLTGFEHTLGVVYGGKEDCADLNNECNDVALHAMEWHAQGRYVFTVKGGCRKIGLFGKIVQPGRVADVDIGGWSDQSRKPTTDVALALWREDGQPVRVRVLNGERPYETPGTGPYAYLFPHPDAWYHGLCVWFFQRTRRIFWK